jgi:hypothetical protein
MAISEQQEFALRFLLEAADEVAANWEDGDLAGAVRNLVEEAEQAREAFGIQREEEEEEETDAT